MPIRKFGYALALCTTLSGAAHATSVNVSLNTSALATDTSDQPFALEFDLENGTLSSNPVNSVSLSNFNFGGGAAFPTTDLTTYLTEGGGSGDIASSVVLLGNSPRNLLSQGFTPGATLSFTISYTNYPTSAPALDTFDFGILDSSGTEIPTRGGRIFDSFIQIDFNSATPTISSFASDPARATGGPFAPVGQGQFLTINAAAIPEPATLGLLGSALAFGGLWKRNRAKLKMLRRGFQNFLVSLGATRSMHAACSRPSTMWPSRSWAGRPIAAETYGKKREHGPDAGNLVGNG